MAFKTPRDIDRRLKRKLKYDVQRKGLIDTWALYRSIDVTAEIDLNFGTFMSANYTFTVTIYAEEYYVYLDDRFNLTQGFIDSQSFRNTIERLRRYFIVYLQNQYPLLKFDNITLDLSDVVIFNQP